MNQYDKMHMLTVVVHEDGSSTMQWYDLASIDPDMVHAAQVLLGPPAVEAVVPKQVLDSGQFLMKDTVFFSRKD